MDKLLQILTRNCRLTNEQISDMTGETPEQVAAKIAELERTGAIVGYQAIVDWDKTDRELCGARIELKVTPKKGMGFEEIAETIAQFDEVDTVCLMSGGYDLALTVTARSFKDVANFVAHRLAPLDSVVSTSTHFILRKYKERGFMKPDTDKDTREVIC